MIKQNVYIINYGMGNLRSVENALKKLNCNCKIINDPNELDNSDKIILPGVGSFKTAINLLDKGGWINKIKYNVLEKKKNIFGICLGMQLLSDLSEENGVTKGLELISGEVKNLKNLGCKLRVPQIGWNNVSIKNKHKYFEGVKDDMDFYFVNSYVFLPKDQSNIIGLTNYDINFCSVISKNNIFGTQFHPEKSHGNGVQLLKNFAELKLC